jgi:hypothetical protein
MYLHAMMVIGIRVGVPNWMIFVWCDLRMIETCAMKTFILSDSLFSGSQYGIVLFGTSLGMLDSQW